MRSIAHKSPIGSVGQDVGPSGVATGRSAFHFRSSIISVGDEENSTDGSFTLFKLIFHIIKHEDFTF
ncbi:hypothetical protein [Rummeliibacillus sp. SL167]|uniref:hypothetical protein n=1 Tax=Rummeliibacillus sp. SL167 TaxID=2579792 RepID=UPI0011B65389|nr:hypothetical protein [Rummeliibacillus sp. SL167]